MSEKQLYPLEDKVVLKSVQDVVSKGGVIIPDLSQENTMVGEVIAVGPGRTKEDGTRVRMSCVVGDMVIFPKFAAHRFEYDDEEYIAIREADIFARISNTSEKTLLQE